MPTIIDLYASRTANADIAIIYFNKLLLMQFDLLNIDDQPLNIKQALTAIKDKIECYREAYIYQEIDTYTGVEFEDKLFKNIDMQYFLLKDKEQAVEFLKES